MAYETARLLRHPDFRPCPQCGNHLKFWNKCDTCRAEPHWPWTCPKCGAEWRATFMELAKWCGACPSPECRRRPTGAELLREMLSDRGKLFERAFEQMEDDDPDLDTDPA